MAKVTVTICDICKERLAISTCPICGKDLCKTCTKNVSFNLAVKFGPALEFWKGNMCDDCFRKIESRYKEIIQELSTKIEPEVVNVVKKYSA
ncbi:MAG: hypothetical protein QW507_02940 [Candidatus Nanoarchaeia archaeon]|nr:hypothetical protein [Candidatus Haiyanarchaeum thermophilum]MCW1303071.1 hypothetical protein [Candidatus Haiyanarchaeum thermophilum]MCW1303736.1 hypothetical protein [Candidatus Haiyanarchaeum thermophilum]MCW1306819.1 hypothetical protein [Candidatus Haiyanarchaeum thermophilum]MCW1307061.1 hypothetical protein [Candidatus Haiyanarchaeum thermophilum]